MLSTCNLFFPPGSISVLLKKKELIPTSPLFNMKIALVELHVVDR